MKRRRLCTMALIALLASAARGSAQGTTGSISGFVTDDTGGALPGATVTVRQAAAIARSSSRPGGTT